MREIKFRAWLKEENRLVYGYEATANPIFTKMFKYRRGEVEVMQFTGLYDKYNTPIYEYDIIKSNKGTVVEVYWLEEDAVFSCRNDKTKFHPSWTLAHFWTDGIEVIGNKFEGVQENKYKELTKQEKLDSGIRLLYDDDEYLAKLYNGDEMIIMRQYIVWEHDNHEGWQEHQFDTLKEASNFKNRLEKVCSNEYVLTKQINVIVEDDKEKMNNDRN